MAGMGRPAKMAVPFTMPASLPSSAVRSAGSQARVGAGALGISEAGPRLGLLAQLFLTRRSTAVTAAPAVGQMVGREVLAAKVEAYITHIVSS